MKTFPLTEEECEDIGGHCYEAEPKILLSYPPQQKRTCKHCGHTQIGQKQDRIDWRDAGED